MGEEGSATERALDLIAKERVFQASLGYNATRDDTCLSGELAAAGACYAHLAASREKERNLLRASEILSTELIHVGHGPGGTDIGYKPQEPATDPGVPTEWPFQKHTYLPDTQKRNLVRAAALIVAELERLERLDRRLERFGVAATDSKSLDFIRHQERVEKLEEENKKRRGRRSPVRQFVGDVNLMDAQQAQSRITAELSSILSAKTYPNLTISTGASGGGTAGSTLVQRI